MGFVQEVQQVWNRLRKSQRDDLNNAAMRDPDAEYRVRCKIVRNLAKGQSIAKIQEVLACARSHIYRVGNRFVELGAAGLFDRRSENGTPKVNEDFEWHVLVAVAGCPAKYNLQRPTWTLELLAIAMQVATGVSVSTSTLSRLLKRERARCKRPKPIVMCPWPKVQKTRRLNELRKLMTRVLSRTDQPDAVLYADEVDIHLNPKIGNDWMLAGQQKAVPTPGRNEKSYLAGGLDARSGTIHWVEFAKKNSDLFLMFLRHLLDVYPRGRIHLILDNYKIHKSRIVQAALQGWAGRIQLHFLPPYCPDHNRIERLWKDLHDNVTRNHTCRTMIELMQNVKSYLTQRNQHGGHCYL